MPTHRFRRALTGLLTAGLLAASLTGCIGPEEDALFCAVQKDAKFTDTPHHVVIVVGNVANAPAPVLTVGMEKVLDKVLEAGGRVDIVSTAGNGKLCNSESLRMRAFKSDTTPAGRASVIQQNNSRIRAEIKRSPQASGADVYAALDLAARQFDSIKAKRRDLLIITSGLNDHGLLDMTVPGALGAEPAETVRELRARNSLVNLKGVTTTIAGLGFTAAPQQELPIASRRAVTDTYRAVLTATHATVRVDPAPATGDSVHVRDTSVKPVTVSVEKRHLPVCKPSTLVFDQTSELRFVADRTAFVDTPGARQALAPVSAWLAEDRSRTVAVQGTTARFGTRDGQRRLGLARARVVATLLRSQGVRSSQITSVRSNGSYFDGYVRDSDDSGTPIASAASKNRSVRLTLQDPCK